MEDGKRMGITGH